MSAAEGGRVLVVLPCLNEAAHLPQVLNDLLSDPGAADARIVVADGGSEDGSLAIVERLAEAHGRVTLLRNPLKRQGAGVNLAVERFGADADLIVRMDAHARYPQNFLRRLIAAWRETGEAAVAVSMRTAAWTQSSFERAVVAAQNSVLGTGGSAHRAPGPRHYVDHGHHALFRKDAFVAAGGYDEGFQSNEDAELDARIAARGGRILLAADIVIDYFPRTDIIGLFRQYLAFGQGRAKTFQRHGGALRLRQTAPLLVAPAAAALFATPLTVWAAAPCAAWLGVCLGYGLLLGLRARDWCACMAGAPAAAAHLAWSLGFWAQIIVGKRPAALMSRLKAA